MTAGRFPARATVVFTGRVEDPFNFGGGTLADGFFCWVTGLKVGARKDRNDSTVAEVHDVVEATARWRFAARAGSSFRAIVSLYLCNLANGRAGQARRPYSYSNILHSNVVEAVLTQS